MHITPDADQEFLLALLHAGAKLERHLDRSLSNIKGISFSEYQLLLSLGGEHNATTTRVDLANAVGLTPSGVTRALKPLEKLGFVETRRDLRDARRSLATLTALGSELVSDAAGVVNDVTADLASIHSLKPAEREKILRFFKQLIHA
jgi:DNA-binding MarR family transcriptional regulator